MALPSSLPRHFNTDFLHHHHVSTDWNRCSGKNSCSVTLHLRSAYDASGDTPTHGQCLPVPEWLAI